MRNLLLNSELIILWMVPVNPTVFITVTCPEGKLRLPHQVINIINTFVVIYEFVFAPMNSFILVLFISYLYAYIYIINTLYIIINKTSLKINSGYYLLNIYFWLCII